MTFYSIQVGYDFNKPLNPDAKNENDKPIDAKDIDAEVAVGT